ncbi:MAG: glucose-1-phosphate adenylyltransferase [Planctomycetes bacterium]|nr:glucose-1-phosphate adenylyltransferase [Planctomycetota bacterium]MBL7039853.1 glucose-1-phosphate adenylyltransferase [Pirellulaceae bacterium]
MQDTLAVILAGGRGERLEPLTRDRAKPAVHFGGAYRIIDFTLSNCVNSGLRKMLLLTQFKSMSLDRHINLGWRRFFCRDLGEFIDIVPPQQRIDDNWYQGTADAVYQNIYTIEKEKPEYVVVLAGDHIYKMDYCAMVDFHKERNADLTIGVLRVEAESASQFGIMETDENSRVVGFEEKPRTPKTVPEDNGHCLASMGIYVFTARFLFEQLLEDANRKKSSHDFGRDIIPSIIKSLRVYAFPFRDENSKDDAYWRDVGTLDAYYEANVDLVSVSPQLNLYDDKWPIRTYQRVLPPPKFVFGGGEDGNRQGRALDSLVCPGCIVSGGTVTGSILGPCARINSYSFVRDSILFEGVDVGRHARIQRAIVEKGVRIPPHAEIGFDLEKDRARGFTVTEGEVVVVPRVDSIEDMLARVA